MLRTVETPSPGPAVERQLQPASTSQPSGTMPVVATAQLPLTIPSAAKQLSTGPPAVKKKMTQLPNLSSVASSQVKSTGSSGSTQKSCLVVENQTGKDPPKSYKHYRPCTEEERQSYFAIIYGGPPQDLPVNVLPTYGDIVRCFFEVAKYEKLFSSRVRLVQEQLSSVWQRCEPLIPVLNVQSIRMKLTRNLKKVKYPSCYLPAQLASDIAAMKDQLFDIALCRCHLPALPCDDERVGCAAAPMCAAQHVICLCAPDKRVPVERGLFLRDQRSSSGPPCRGGKGKRPAREAVFQIIIITKTDRKWHTGTLNCANKNECFYRP